MAVGVVMLLGKIFIQVSLWTMELRKMDWNASSSLKNKNHIATMLSNLFQKELLSEKMSGPVTSAMEDWRPSWSFTVLGVGW